MGDSVRDREMDVTKSGLVSSRNLYVQNECINNIKRNNVSFRIPKEDNTSQNIGVINLLTETCIFHDL